MRICTSDGDWKCRVPEFPRNSRDSKKTSTRQHVDWFSSSFRSVFYARKNLFVLSRIGHCRIIEHRQMNLCQTFRESEEGRARKIVSLRLLFDSERYLFH